MLSLSQDIEVESVGVSCTFFTLTFSFLGSVSWYIVYRCPGRTRAYFFAEYFIHIFIVNCQVILIACTCFHSLLYFLIDDGFTDHLWSTCISNAKVTVNGFCECISRQKIEQNMYYLMCA